VDGFQFPANIPILGCDISTLQCILGTSSGVKRPGCEADHSDPSESGLFPTDRGSALIHNRWKNNCEHRSSL
jgi:hypothetical protein